MNAGDSGERLSIVEFAKAMNGDDELWSCLVGQAVEHFSFGEGRIVDVQRRKHLPLLVHVDFAAHKRASFTPEGFAKGVFTKLTFPAGFDERVRLYLAQKARSREEAEVQAREERAKRLAISEAERATTSKEEPPPREDERQRGWEEYKALSLAPEFESRNTVRAERAEQIAHLQRRLTAQQQTERHAIDQCLRKREIRHLVHFTRAENLVSILQHGIVPRAILKVPFVHNDEVRADGYQEASCLSVEFPHYEMFYSYRCKCQDANWAVLLVSVDVLKTKPCMFYPGNAASSIRRAQANAAVESLMGYGGLEGMFADNQEEGLRIALGLPANFPTDPQAEVLMFDVIEPTFIRQVGLMKRDPRLVAEVAGVAPSLSLVHGGPLFSPRLDWQIRKLAALAGAADGGLADDMPF